MITDIIKPRMRNGSLCRDTFARIINHHFVEEINSDLFRECVGAIDAVLADAQRAPADVHDVILVGGSTRIPKLRALVRELFGGKEPCADANSDWPPRLSSSEARSPPSARCCLLHAICSPPRARCRRLAYRTPARSSS